MRRGKKRNRSIPADTMASPLSCCTTLLLVSAFLLILPLFLSHNMTFYQRQLIIHSLSSNSLSNTFIYNSTNSSSTSTSTALITNTSNTNYTNPPARVSLDTFLPSSVHPNNTSHNVGGKKVSILEIYG